MKHIVYIFSLFPGNTESNISVLRITISSTLKQNSSCPCYNLALFQEKMFPKEFAYVLHHSSKLNLFTSLTAFQTELIHSLSLTLFETGHKHSESVVLQMHGTVVHQSIPAVPIPPRAIVGHFPALSIPGVGH